MGNTQFNHAVLARVAKSLMRSCGVRTRITCVFHRVNFKWAQCASPQPAPSHLEFALTLACIPSDANTNSPNGRFGSSNAFGRQSISSSTAVRSILFGHGKTSPGARLTTFSPLGGVRGFRLNHPNMRPFLYRVFRVLSGRAMIRPRVCGLRIPLLCSHGFTFIAHELTEQEQDSMRIAR